MDLAQWAIRPWSAPSGVLGRLAGWEMARGKAPLNTLVEELLALEGGEDVLEVGFGPGATVAHLARLTSGRVAGADPSPVMLAQAIDRNLDAVRDGRVDLRLAAAERLPFGDCEFDVAVAANTVGHWRSQAEGFAEVRRVLRPGGRFLVVMRGAREPALADSGFARVEIEARELAGRTVTTALAVR